MQPEAARPPEGFNNTNRAGGGQLKSDSTPHLIAMQGVDDQAEAVTMHVAEPGRASYYFV